MTSLRTFQNEIDEIHHREVAKQRTKALAEKVKEKDPKDPKEASKQPVKADKAAKAEKTEKGEKEDRVADSSATDKPSSLRNGEHDDGPELSETEEKIQVCATPFLSTLHAYQVFWSRRLCFSSSKPIKHEI